MDYVEDRSHHYKGQFKERFSIPRNRDLFDWDLAYRKAAEALKRNRGN